MYVRRPYFFKDFKCISSECSDSCCEDWEIDIDQDTLDYYMSVGGEFGKRLKENIFVPSDENTEEDGDVVLPHFIQTKEERCPFLNECNLCDIFINLGEEHLSQICTHHPRFYDWLLEGQEAGLGLCCEEAARLMLIKRQKGDYFELLEVADDEGKDGKDDFESSANVQNEDKTDFALAEDELDDEESYEIERKIEDTLLNMRKQFMERIDLELFDKEAFQLDELMNDFARMSLEFQDSYDTILFPEMETEAVEEFSWTEEFFQIDYLNRLLTFYMQLEVNDMSWWELLKDCREKLSKIVSARSEFEAYYEDRMYEYGNLLSYFVFRYFLKTRMDDALTDKIQLALISVGIIEVLDIYHWLEKGELTLTDQINICKLYSKEIEYDEYNAEQIMEYR